MPKRRTPLPLDTAHCPSRVGGLGRLAHGGPQDWTPAAATYCGIGAANHNTPPASAVEGTRGFFVLGIVPKPENAMTDETDDEDLDIEFEEAQPRAVMFDVPEGQIMIPCLDSLAEALGDAPLALWAHEKGLMWLTPKRRWEPLEADSGPKVASIRKN